MEVTARENRTPSEHRRRARKNLAGKQIKVDLGFTRGVIRDLSETGICIETLTPLELAPGERLHIHVLDPAKPIQAGCELAWAKAAQAGMRFLVLSENSERSIRGLLHGDAAAGDTIRIPPPASVKTAASLPLAAAQVGLPQPAARATTGRSPDQPSPAAKTDPNPTFTLSMQLIAELAKVLSRASGVCIALREEGEVAVCCASAGSAPVIGSEVMPGSGIAGACLASGAITQSHDTESDPRVNAEVCRKLYARSVAAVPIFCRERTVGVVLVLSRDRSFFGSKELRWLPALAELVGNMRDVASAEQTAPSAGGSSATRSHAVVPAFTGSC